MYSVKFLILNVLWQILEIRPKPDFVGLTTFLNLSYVSSNYQPKEMQNCIVCTVVVLLKWVCLVTYGIHIFTKSRNQEIDNTKQLPLYWCFDLMCRVNTFFVFPDQVHSGQLKSSREDDAGALEAEVEGRGKGSVADPAAAKLTFMSLENLENKFCQRK